ncbi:MAG: hypothetical protein KKD11_06565 [Candidatus Omnitrophica bacterium]|nr:hypothetical protein [Candidatus Omnitrophota bacterium]
MIGIRKEYNLVLIFTLIGIFLCPNPAYSIDANCLRVPLNFTANEDKPFNEMEFEELIWWYKAFFIAMRENFLPDRFFYEVVAILKKKYKIEKQKTNMESFFIWVKRVHAKECYIPMQMYNHFNYKDKQSFIKKLTNLQHEMNVKTNSLDPENNWISIKVYTIKMMNLIEEVKNLTYEDSTFLDLFYVDGEGKSYGWPPYMQNYYLGDDYNADQLRNTPSILTKDDVTFVAPPSTEDVSLPKSDL